MSDASGQAAGGDGAGNGASREAAGGDGARAGGASRGNAGRGTGMKIQSRLFLSYVAVLAIAVVVAFASSEAVTPFMMRWHGAGSMGQGMGGPMRSRPDTDGSRGTQPSMMGELDAAYESATQRSMLLGLAAGLLVAAGASAFMTRRIAGPLRDMHDASERIAEGRYGERLDESAPGEVGDLAAAFNRMAAELEATESRRSSLIGNVAHEFRTPLTSLQGYLEGVADGHFTMDEDTIDSCNRQVSRLRTLVDDLALLSRVEAGVEPVNPRPCRLSPILEQARVDLLKRFEKKGVNIQVDVNLGASASHGSQASDAGPTPDAGRTGGAGSTGSAGQAGGGADRVNIDPDRTLQIVENLLTNALRHTPSGGRVTVTARRRTDSRIVVSVKDTGEGIPESALPHVFERFYRADQSRSRRREGDGTGIGLTVARAFAQAQGGSLWVERTSESGTVISFTV